MQLSEMRKALVPLVSVGLVWLANALGLAPEVVTTEFAGTVTAFLVATAAAVYRIPNKEPTQ